ncbi:MAG: hypothetical protein ABI681_03225 [Gemmatimonadales bacterium]
MRRRTIAIAVIAVWVAGLLLLYRRNTIRTPEAALIEVGMRVSPQTYYYTLQQGEKQVGAASSAIDTTRTRVIASDFVRGEIPVGDDVLRMEARSQARFSRGMRLQEFVIRAVGDLTPFTIRGVMQESDVKTLRVSSSIQGQRPIVQETVVTQPVFVPTVSPLPLLLKHDPKTGDSARVAIFDPLSRRVQEVTLHVHADSLFLIADSASFDSTSGRWVKAHQDSVRGWRITGPSSPLTAWVDRSGRVIAASEPGGISLVRTTFELAFANWTLGHPASTTATGPRGSRIEETPPDTSHRSLPLSGGVRPRLKP